MKKALLFILCLVVLGINYSEARTKKSSKKNVKKTTAVVSPSVYNKTYYGTNVLYASGNGNSLRGDMEIVFYEKRDEPASFCKINLYANYDGRKIDMGSMVSQFFIKGDTLEVNGRYANPDAKNYGAVSHLAYSGYYDYGFDTWCFIVPKDAKSIRLQEDAIKQDGKTLYVSGTLYQTSGNSNNSNSTGRQGILGRSPNASDGQPNVRVGRGVIVY